MREVDTVRNKELFAISGVGLIMVVLLFHMDPIGIKGERVIDWWSLGLMAIIPVVMLWARSCVRVRASSIEVVNIWKTVTVPRDQIIGVVEGRFPELLLVDGTKIPMHGVEHSLLMFLRRTSLLGALGLPLVNEGMPASPSVGPAHFVQRSHFRSKLLWATIGLVLLSVVTPLPPTADQPGVTWIAVRFDAPDSASFYVPTCPGESVAHVQAEAWFSGHGESRVIWTADRLKGAGPFRLDADPQRGLESLDIHVMMSTGREVEGNLDLSSWSNQEAGHWSFQQRSLQSLESIPDPPPFCG